MSRVFSAVKAASKSWLAVSILTSALFLTLGSSLAHPERPAYAGARLPFVSIDHAPVEVVRDKRGNALAVRANQYTTFNWSGYVLPKFQTGQAYTSAQATWVVPTVPATKRLTISSNWVGIGGFCENQSCSKVDHKLIQLGTLQGALKKQVSYFTWYEILPQALVVTPLAVNPGDLITASLGCNPCTGTQSWDLSMVDETTGDNWSTTVNYQASQLSLEWILEAPLTNRGIAALSNYGTDTFDQSIANGAGADLSLGDSIVMRDPHHQTSSVSGLDGTDDGFSTCFGEKHLTPCFFNPLP